MTILFWIHKSKANTIGQAPLYMRITIEGERAEINTNVPIKADQWDGEIQRVKGNSDLIKEYNARIVNLATLKGFLIFQEAFFII